MLRATGVVSLLAIGAVHFLQIVPTTESTPLLGVSFLFLIAACLAVAARLATSGDHRTWTASAVVCGAAIGGYVFTRTFSTPLDNQDAGNWSCMLGLAALFVETTLLGFSVYAALAHRALRTAVEPGPRRRRARPGRAQQFERGVTADLGFSPEAAIVAVRHDRGIATAADFEQPETILLLARRPGRPTTWPAPPNWPLACHPDGDPAGRSNH